MATKPFTVPNNFTGEGSGTANNIPLLDNNFTAQANYNNDGSFFTMLGTDIGTPNAYVVTMPSGYIPTAYNKGTLLYFYPANTNTGASTININGLGLANIKRADGSALVGGEFQASKLACVVYDGTNFIVSLPSGPGTVIYYDYDDLISFPYAATSYVNFGSKLLFFGQNANGGSLPYNGSSLGIAGHVGVVVMTCGTTTANTVYATVTNNTTSGSVFLDSFTYTIRSILKTETTLSSNAVFLGLTNSSGNPIGINQRYVGFNGSSASGFWTMVSCNGTSSQTNTATSAAIASNTWYDLMVVVNSSSATYYVNGSQVGTISTNMPSSTALLNIGVTWAANSGINTSIFLDTFELLVTGMSQVGTNPRFLHGIF